VNYDLLVFDLDGTLVDSAPDIADSLLRVLARMGRPPISREKVVASIGSGVRKLIERTSEPPHEPVLEAFMREYGEHLLDRTRLFPGVAETLAALPGRKIILSNKPSGFSRRVVDGLKIAAHFEAVYGGDSFPVKKPDAACFRRAADGAPRSLMVGDSGVDVETARNAGVPICAVTYGYYKPGELDGADFRIDAFAQLLDLLR
jgi:phosphoglycolate phosphatase